jgi:bacteriophage N4 adsorption protein B
LGDLSLDLLILVRDELLLFAACGFILFGIDDLLLDSIWLARVPIVRFRPASPPGRAENPGRHAVFIPAWDEAAVIGPMLMHTLRMWERQDVCILVGCYPNDAATTAIVASMDSNRLRLVVGDRIGPTTKADCLNNLWHALNDIESKEGWQAKSIILHDAEDFVHPDEITLFDALIEQHDLVQIPVHPLPDTSSRWIAGHYLDEFAESHGKDLAVRTAVGASLPSAGVGCAIARPAVAKIAALRGGKPFDASSLTEDYELGLTLHQLGFRSIFASTKDEHGEPVCVRAHFPGNLSEAVRQKTRWITGIALAGWDRTGWAGGPAEWWMRWRDRRSILAALLILSGYCGMTISLFISITGTGERLSEVLSSLLNLCALLFLWRLAIRVAFTTFTAGWAEGLRSLPRAFVSNIIAVMAARRAVGCYLTMRRTGLVVWDKTRHQFPESG